MPVISMKGRLSGFRRSGNKVYARIRDSSVARRNYLRFRNEVTERFGARTRGCCKYTEITGEGIDINIFRGDGLMHVLMYADGERLDALLNILMKYFEFP